MSACLSCGHFYISNIGNIRRRYAGMLHEVSFKSFNERDEVQGWVYVPACDPIGIIQLVHGFGEHSRRYLHMISALMDAGFIVAADDHVGHGKTAIVNDVWSDWGDKGPHTMTEDEYSLMEIVKDMYPDLPYFMYGHSMGSFIARDFIASYGYELSGVVLCGTTGIFPGAEEGAKVLREACNNGKAMDRDPEMLNMLMGWMCERCDEEIEFGNEWICDDYSVQYDHANDPFDAFTKPCTNRCLLDFVEMMLQITGKEWAESVPEELPILNIAGDCDPVGQYGEGVYKVSNWLISTGHEVETKLYPGYRHEIHNYPDLKFCVEDDIIEFITGIAITESIINPSYYDCDCEEED